jgi:hypothetical protein
MDPGVRKQLQGMMEDRAVPDLHLGLSSDPTYLIQALRDLTAEADTLLGWQEIEGVEALGFELSGAKAGFGPPLFDNAMDNMVRLWIDFQSALPVRVELHFVSKVAPIESTGMSARFAIDAVYDQFELDPPITAELFNAAIPADYTPIEEMTGLAPQFSEEALLESLRVFSELTGRYPSSLNTFSVAHEISFVIGSLQAKQIAAKSRGAGTADLPKVSEVGPKLQGFTYFTKLEADGAAPAYFGDKVKPGDGESILMQWTLPGGTTRVIYGDLSIETLP